MIRQRYPQHAGYRTRELYVEGAGPTLVLVHGFEHPAPCWGQVLTRCADAGRAAVAVDLPGFGAADPLSAGLRLPQLVRFLEAVVTAHGSAEPVVLVGNSLGATTAVRLLDTVKGLPVSGLLALNIASDQWTPMVRAALAGGGRPLLGLSRLPLPKRVATFAARRGLYGDHRTADPEMVRLLIERMGNRLGRVGQARFAIEMAREVAVIASVRHIGCPTVIVHGRRDRVVAIAASVNLHAAIAGSRLELLAGIGHCPHLDAPDQITALALDLAAGSCRPQTA